RSSFQFVTQATDFQHLTSNKQLFEFVIALIFVPAKDWKHFNLSQRPAGRPRLTAFQSAGAGGRQEAQRHGEWAQGLDGAQHQRQGTASRRARSTRPDELKRPPPPALLRAAACCESTRLWRRRLQCR